MPASRKTSPTLTLTLTDEQRERAIASNSGGCLIADAIRQQYPHLTGVVVDMATIRVTDRERRERYTYITPPAAQHVLLSFDQGWPNPVSELVIRRAVHIGRVRVHDASPSHRRRAERSRARLALLERREADGDELTPGERMSLSRLRSYWSKHADDVPEVDLDGRGTDGPREVRFVAGQAVVSGGKAPAQGAAHPNLLRGRNRHFGAKLADPGQAFRDAVDAAVAERIAQQGQT